MWVVEKENKHKNKNKYMLYSQMNRGVFFLSIIEYYNIYGVYITCMPVLLHGPSVCIIVNALT